MTNEILLSSRIDAQMADRQDEEEIKIDMKMLEEAEKMVKRVKNN